MGSPGRWEDGLSRRSQEQITDTQGLLSTMASSPR